MNQAKAAKTMNFYTELLLESSGPGRIDFNIWFLLRKILAFLLTSARILVGDCSQGFDMDRSTPATQIDGGNGN